MMKREITKTECVSERMILTPWLDIDTEQSSWQASASHTQDTRIYKSRRCTGVLKSIASKHIQQS